MGFAEKKEKYEIYHQTSLNLQPNQSLCDLNTSVTLISQCNFLVLIRKHFCDAALRKASPIKQSRFTWGQ